jgi:hypothetical protein
MRIYKKGEKTMVAFEIERPSEMEDLIPFPVIVIKPGNKGFWEGKTADPTIPAAVAKSALEASMFGWHTKAATLAREYAEQAASANDTLNTDSPNQTQLEALQRFANKHGRTWKQALNWAWESGTYMLSDKGRELDDESELQRVRNQYGPHWLNSKKNTIRPE